MTEERKPHPRADVLKAIAEGKTIQVRVTVCDTQEVKWLDIDANSYANSLISSDSGLIFRIKPEPAVLYIGLRKIDTDPVYTSVFTWVQHCKNVIKLTFDATSEKVTSVELVK